MALHNYRYRHDGIVSDATLQSQVHSTATANGVGNQTFVDVDCDDSIVEDLHSYMGELGYTHISTDPVTTLAQDAAGSLDHVNLANIGTNTHAQLDSHVASTANPHAVTKAQVGLTNVTDDSQLTRAAGDFATFTAKATPAAADVFLIEDSAAGGAKKKVVLSGLTAGLADETRDMIAGAGLTGGGDLTADRTFDVVANADGSLVVNANDIQVGVLATDAQHGDLGAGSLHSLTSSSDAGFQPQSNRTATTSPTATDDSAAGYVVGSYWVNLTTDEPFMCVDATATAAVWKSITSTGMDDLVKVSAADTTSGYLTTKIVGGNGITLTTVNPGGDEDLSFSVTVADLMPDGASPLTTAAAGSISDATNDEGTANSFARSDHSHAHGDLLGGTHHALTSSSDPGFMPQSNLASATTPAVSDDNTGGYAVGSRWVNTTTDVEYVCTDASTGAAIWRKTVNSACLTWGSNRIQTSATARYLAPGSQQHNAPTNPWSFPAPRAGTLKNMRVYNNVVGAGGSTLTYTLWVGGVATSLAASMLPTDTDGSDLVNTAAVAAGDLLDIRVTKSAAITTSPTRIMVSMEFDDE